MKKKNEKNRQKAKRPTRLLNECRYGAADDCLCHSQNLLPQQETGSFYLFIFFFQIAHIN